MTYTKPRALTYDEHHAYSGGKKGKPFSQCKCELGFGKTYITTDRAATGNSKAWLIQNASVFQEFLDDPNAEAERRFWPPAIDWIIRCNVWIGPDHWIRHAAPWYAS